MFFPCSHPNGVFSLLKYPSITCGTEDHLCMWDPKPCSCPLRALCSSRVGLPKVSLQLWSLPQVPVTLRFSSFGLACAGFMGVAGCQPVV